MKVNNPNIFYPSAKEWMWSYCTHLGPFIDSTGRKYDLGLLIHEDGTISNATVYGNERWEYISGIINPKRDYNNEIVQEVIRRAKIKGIIK